MDTEEPAEDLAVDADGDLDRSGDLVDPAAQDVPQIGQLDTGSTLDGLVGRTRRGHAVDAKQLRLAPVVGDEVPHTSLVDQAVRIECVEPETAVISGPVADGQSPVSENGLLEDAEVNVATCAVRDWAARSTSASASGRSSGFAGPSASLDPAAAVRVASRDARC